MPTAPAKDRKFLVRLERTVACACMREVGNEFLFRREAIRLAQ
jgi:hypothetical protein